MVGARDLGRCDQLLEVAHELSKPPRKRPRSRVGCARGWRGRRRRCGWLRRSSLPRRRFGHVGVFVAAFHDRRSVTRYRSSACRGHGHRRSARRRRGRRPLWSSRSVPHSSSSHQARGHRCRSPTPALSFPPHATTAPASARTETRRCAVPSAKYTGRNSSESLLARKEVWRWYSQGGGLRLLLAGWLPWRRWSAFMLTRTTKPSSWAAP